MMGSQPDCFVKLFRSEVNNQFDKMLRRINHCAAQLNEDQLWWRPDDSMNSIANLLLHLCGNVQQWIIHAMTAAPDTRDRPYEFAQRQTASKTVLLDQIKSTVARAKEVIANADEMRLTAECCVQGFDTTGLGAIMDSVTHFQGHTQEIVNLTRQQLGDAYQFEWTPTEEGQAP